MNHLSLVEGWRKGGGEGEESPMSTFRLDIALNKYAPLVGGMTKNPHTSASLPLFRKKLKLCRLMLKYFGKWLIIVQLCSFCTLRCAEKHCFTKFVYRIHKKGWEPLPSTHTHTQSQKLNKKGVFAPFTLWTSREGIRIWLFMIQRSLENFWRNHKKWYNVQGSISPTF